MRVFGLISRTLLYPVFLTVLFFFVLFTGTAQADTLTLPAQLTDIKEEAFFADHSLDEVVLPDHILRIGDRAFANSSVQKIVLPASLTFIADDAFDHCPNLVLYVDSGTYAHTWCQSHNKLYAILGVVPEGVQFSLDDTGYRITGYTGTANILVLPDEIDGIPVYAINSHVFSEKQLKAIHLPNGLKTIGSNAFSNNTTLTEIVLPNGLESIGSNAFYNCSGLTSITLPVDIDYSSAFKECYNIQTIHYTPGKTGIMTPKSTNIDSSYFWEISLEYRCRNHLTSVIFDEGITSISGFAFYYCSVLSSVALPSTLQSIGANAFCGASSLVHFDFPNKLQIISANAFLGTGLEEIILPDSVITISERAFENCSFLSSVIFPNGLKTIGSNAFSNNTTLTEIVLPNGLESIGSNAFYNCSGLTSITLPVDIDYSSAFKECYNIQTIHYTPGKTGIMTPKSTNIDSSYFWEISLEYRCRNHLTSVIFDEGITSISGFAFYYCSVLSSVALPSTLQSIGANAFSGCTSLQKLILPMGCTFSGSGLSEDQVIQTLDPATVIQSVWMPDSDTADIFNIYFTPIDGDVEYILYASDVPSGPFTEVARGSTQYLKCKHLIHDVAKGMPVYYKIAGPGHITEAFDPRNYHMGYDYETIDAVQSGNVTVIKIRVDGIYAGATLKKLDIPDEINHRKVTEISPLAISRHAQLSLVSLPQAAASNADAIRDACPSVTVIVRTNEKPLFDNPIIFTVVLQDDRTTMDVNFLDYDFPDGIGCQYILQQYIPHSDSFVYMTDHVQSCRDYDDSILDGLPLKRLTCQIREDELYYFRVEKTVFADNGQSYVLESQIFKVDFSQKHLQMGISAASKSRQMVSLSIDTHGENAYYAVCRLQNSHYTIPYLFWDLGSNADFIFSGNMNLLDVDADPNTINTYGIFDAFIDKNEIVFINKGNCYGETRCFPLEIPNITVVQEDTSACIEWNEIVDATRYEVKIYKHGDLESLIEQTVDTNQTSCAISPDIESLSVLVRAVYYDADASLTSRSEYGKATLICDQDRGVVRKLSLHQVNYTPYIWSGTQAGEDYLNYTFSSATPEGLPLVSNSVYYDKNKEEIMQLISTHLVSQARDQDVSILYIACHGCSNIVSGENAGALSLYDGTHMTFRELSDMLSGIHGKVFIILGSCGSGSSIGEIYGAPSDPFAPLIAPNNYVLCGAMGGIESLLTGYTIANYGYNQIAYYLYQSLSHGDLNGDGVITMKELGDYVAACAFLENNEDPFDPKYKFTAYYTPDDDYPVLVPISH